MDYLGNGLSNVISKIFGSNNCDPSSLSEKEIKYADDRLATSSEAIVLDVPKKNENIDRSPIGDINQIEVDLEKLKFEHNLTEKKDIIKYRELTDGPFEMAEETVVDLGDNEYNFDENMNRVRVVDTTTTKKKPKNDLSKISTSDLMKNIETFNDDDFKKIFGQQDEGFYYNIFSKRVFT